jgi:fructose-1,6-bisphosphatase/inositol monophosphatase family enzyme
MRATAWTEILKDIVNRCLREVKPLLTTAEGSRIIAIKPDRDATTAAEIKAESIAAAIIEKSCSSASLFSEEQEYLLHPPSASHLVLFDPVDCTHLAVRGLPGACVGICVMDLAQQDIVSSAIGDYYNGDLYWADEGGAFRNGKPVHPTTITRLTDAYVATCYGKASRVRKMLAGEGMTRDAFWIDSDGGILAMARVGDGRIDAYFDLMLGYKPYDFAPGAHFAARAGASVTDEYGNPIRWSEDQRQRCKFVIAATAELNEAICRSAGSSL